MGKDLGEDLGKNKRKQKYPVDKFDRIFLFLTGTAGREYAVNFTTFCKQTDSLSAVGLLAH